HKLPGLVSISTPGVEDAEVIIDGISMGTTPLIDLEVEAGERLLRINKTRYLPYEIRISINGSGERQSFEYNPLPGWADVYLVSEPEGVLVSEGELELGTTPVSLQLMAGAHTLLFSKTNFTSKILDLSTVAGQDIRPAPIILSPSPATLQISTQPDGALVMIDQKYRGRSPLQVSISSGEEHLLKLYAPGREAITQMVKASPNEVREITIPLKPEYGNVFLFAEPPDSRLFIDGKEYGPAVGHLHLPLRPHILEVKAEGYTTGRETITPTVEYDQQIEIKLLPKNSPPSSTGGAKMITNSVGVQLIRLNPAVFTMGSSRSEPGRRANEAQRRVRISRPFLLAGKEVSNGEFRRFKKDHSSGSFQGQSLDGDDQPAVNISWEDAARYCNWLSSKEGLAPFYIEKNNTMVPSEPATKGYRLPLEAEWAYAARMAGRREEARYGWEGEYPPNKTTGNYGDISGQRLLNVIINGYNDHFAVSAPVGSFAPNTAGFFDLDGNVSEWCNDFYSSTMDDGGGEILDPVGPPSGTHHVVRGASWRDASITELRLSYRGYSREPLDDIGFRVARYE
ncbi:MAG: SUMF1/EgtB/PvdO family nonheme iron enzyme, partial [Desulfobulbaceae bacterium]|nr:SUMF1/EgtB/PvdO family nonheme iron enzyme [Desulfobulbaceae bacterium]